MDSRRRQRSIALDDIPPHGLEYPLAFWMHFCFVHPRQEARGQPFPRSLGFCSRGNLRELRPLSWGPHGQPSSLRTHHGRPGVLGIFPTSSCRAPHGWRMVHHSMATGFPIHWVVVRPLSHTPLPRPCQLSSRVYTRMGRQQAFGTGPLDPHISGDHFAHLARVAPIPSPFPVLWLPPSAQPQMFQSAASSHIYHAKAPRPVS